MTGGHLDVDALADLLAAEGSAADVEHVARCAGCAGRLDELAAAEDQVVAVLHALPAPPVPAGLQERLSAAFAAEPPPEVPDLDVATAAVLGEPAPSRGTGPATVTPFAARPRRAVPGWLAAAAVVLGVLVLGGGLAAVTDLGGDEAADTTAAGPAADSAADPFAGLTVNDTGRDYTDAASVAAVLPELLEGDAPRQAAAVAEDRSDAEAPEAAPAPQPSGDASAFSSAAGAVPSDPLARLRDPAARASCLRALLPPDDPDLRPLALDYAAYSGEPALVVVLPAQGDTTKVDVFVVGAGCSEGADGTLFFARLDRP
jgi:hypothetical protein